MTQAREILIPDISKVELKPDDVLVFKLKEDLTNAEIRMVAKSIETVLPRQRYVILDNGASLDVLAGIPQLP